MLQEGAPSPVPIPANSSVNPWAIGLTTKTLTSAKAADVDRARALRFLTHFVGDLHQPLHAAELFSAQFPDGDVGGNGVWRVLGNSRVCTCQRTKKQQLM